tara:strand:+ start:140 stop:346 length:207 start_codon:yes stop_codon:yes gene_type:complete
MLGVSFLGFCLLLFGCKLIVPVIKPLINIRINGIPINPVKASKQILKSLALKASLSASSNYSLSVSSS